MKKIIMSIAILGFCSGAFAYTNSGTEAGPPVFKPGELGREVQVLFYSEMDQGANVYQHTLQEMGWWDATTFTSSHATFKAQLESGTEWTHIVSNHSNTYAAAVWQQPLWNYVSTHPDTIALCGDWREHAQQQYWTDMGFGYTHQINFYSGTPDAGGIFDGLADAAFQNMGWGRFSWEVSEPRHMTSAYGGPAIERSEVNDNWFGIGIVGDGWVDLGVGYDYVYTMLTIPEPTSLAMLALGGFLVVRRRR